jgi:ferric-dicitrate binding protein FerR (iron transport regulator)
MEEQHNLAKWLAGEMDENELKAFESSAGFTLYERIATHSAQLQTPAFDGEKLLGDIISGKKKSKVIPIYRSAFGRIAAVLVIAFGLFWVFRPVDVVEVAQNGKQHTAFLPDSSEVALNSGSEIHYSKSNWHEKRQLSLKGEAFFKVAKGARFDVLTSLGTVTVVGTQFNVKVRGNRFEVECFEGKVWVRNGKNSVLLTKGRILVSDSGKLLDATPSATQKPDWLQGRLRFISTPIDAIIAELERNYNIHIEIGNAVSSSHFTGQLDATDLNKALLVLCKAYNLNAKTTTNKVVLSANAQL